MSITNRQLLDCFQALNELSMLPNPVYPNGKVSYMITRNLDVIRQNSKAYEEERKKIFDGKGSINDFPEEERAAINAKMNDLLDIEIEVPFHKCAYENFNAKENKIPARVFVALAPVVIYSEEDMKS